MSSRSSVGSGPPPPVSKKLHQYGCKEVAQELAVMDAEMLRKIAPEELQNGAWMKKDKKYQLAPNVMAMVESFNRLALLVPTEILEEKTPQTRAKIVTSFIQIASKCYRLHNYNSLKAVLAGLQCTPIFRLKKTWKEVPSKRKKRFNQLTSLMSEEQNWTAYRHEVEQKIDSNSPCIPFLGIFLTTIALSQEADNLTVDKGLERRRTSSFYETYHVLEAITVRNKLNRLRNQASKLQEDDGIMSPSPNAPSDSDNEDIDKDCTSSSSSASTLQQTTSSTSVTSNQLVDSSPFAHSPSFTSQHKDASGTVKSSPAVNGTPASKAHAPILSHTRPIPELDEKSETYQPTKVRPSSADASTHRVDTEQASTPRRSSGNIRRTIATERRGSTKRPSLIRDATLSGSLECLLDAVSTSDDDTGWDTGLLKSTSLQSIDSIESGQRASDSDIEIDDVPLEAINPEETLKPAKVQLLKDHATTGLSTKHESLQNVFNRQNEHSFVHNDEHKPHKQSNGYHGDLLLHNAPPPAVAASQRNHQEMTSQAANNHSPSKSTMQTTPKHSSAVHSTQQNVLTSLPVLHPRRPSFSPRVGHFLKHTISVPSINFHRERRVTPDVPKMRIIKLEKSSNPVDLLQQYQFLSLGCCSGSECSLELRRLLTKGSHNSEAQNYKLSYEREPM